MLDEARLITLPPPPPPPPPPPKIETPEEAIAQANHDAGGTVLAATPDQTRSNLASSRESAISTALQEGRSGDVQQINQAYDLALARLDADFVVQGHKPEGPTQAGEFQTVDGVTSRTSTYADGTRVVQTQGQDASGNPVVTTQVFEPGATGPAAQVPLESRTVVANGEATSTGLPTRTVEEAPDGSGSIITDHYGGEGEEAQRVVQHMVIRNGGEGGYQVQSVIAREDGTAVETPQPLRIRELAPNGEVLFDTGEVSRVTTEPMPGRAGVSLVTHVYDSGARMEYRVHAAPEGSEDVPPALLSQRLVGVDGDELFQRDGLSRTQTDTSDGGAQVVDTAADGSTTTYTVDADGKLTQQVAAAANGSVQQAIDFEQVEGLPVVDSRTTVTHADGTQVISEYNAEGQPVGIRKLDASGDVVEQLGSLDGERIENGSADSIASDILDVGKKTLRKDDYEARLSYALGELQDMDPVSQQQVLEALQEQDPGMGDSWFKTDILENLGSDQLQGLEDGGLDILTGMRGTTALDIEASRDIHNVDVDAGEDTGEYGELAASSEEQHAGQLAAYKAEYESRAGDPEAQARFVAVYQRMHGDDLVEGFLSDENLSAALEDGVSMYKSGDTVRIDQSFYTAVMGNRLETAADSRSDVLAARDRVMDTGVRDYWTDNYEARVRALVTEMQGLDAEGQAALMRQIVKEDPDARLSWLRDGSINEATQGNEAFTPEMRELVLGIRGNGETTFGGQVLGFGSGLKNAGWGFVVGLGALARTAYDLGPAGLVVDAATGGNAPAWAPSAQRGLETGQSMIEGLPNMFDHIGEAWSQGRYGEALGGITFDVASMIIPVKIPRVRLPGAAGAADNIAGAADNVAGAPRYIDSTGRPVTGPAVEPQLLTQGPDGVYRATDDVAPPGNAPRGIEGVPRRLELEAAATPEVIAQRQATAVEFYERATGRTVDPSHLNGIDFTRPVEVQTLREGTIVYQWQAPGAPTGSYFSPSATARPTDIGISSVGVPPHIYSRVSDYLRGIDPDAPPTHVRNSDGTYSGMDPQFGIEVAPGGIVDKVPVAYRVTSDVDVLVSTARTIDDTWAIPDRSMTAIPTEGGRLQIFTGDRGLFQPVASSATTPMGPSAITGTGASRQLTEVSELPIVNGRLAPLQAGEVLVGSSRAQMRSHAAKQIASDPNHPLRFLLNPDTQQFWTRTDFGYTRNYTHADLSDNPVLLDMGHIASNKSLTNGGDRIMLQSVFENQWNNRSIESPRVGGHVVDQRAVDVGGVAVSFNDVKMWTELTVDADMAARLQGMGYQVGDTFLPPSILEGLVNVN